MNFIKILFELENEDFFYVVFKRKRTLKNKFLHFCSLILANN